MKRNFGFYLRLFFTNLYISAFSFGGGYVVIPMLRKQFIIKQKLFTEKELTDMAAIAQSSPGAIAVNLTVLVGKRVGGILGALIACVATVLPPLVILAVVSVCYTALISNPVVSAVLKGMQAGVCALIVTVVLDMGATLFGEKQTLMSVLVPLSFGASFVFNVNAAIVILVCAALCFTVGLTSSRLKKRKEKRAK